MRLALHWQILIAMVLGAAAGIILNQTSGSQRMSEPLAIESGTVQPLGGASTKLPACEVWVEDSANQTLIRISQPNDAEAHRYIAIRGPIKDPVEQWPDGETPDKVEEYTTLKQLKSTDPIAWSIFQTQGRSFAPPHR